MIELNLNVESEISSNDSHSATVQVVNDEILQDSKDEKSDNEKDHDRQVNGYDSDESEDFQFADDDYTSKKLEDTLNLIMFPQSNMTFKDVLNMIQAIYLKHNVSKFVDTTF